MSRHPRRRLYQPGKTLARRIHKRYGTGGLSGLDRYGVEVLIQGTLYEMAEILGQGDTLKLKDFATFEPHFYTQRGGIDIGTGAPLQHRRAVQVRFKPSRLMERYLQHPKFDPRKRQAEERDR